MERTAQNLQVIVNQSYNELTMVSLPYEQTIEGVLKSYGIHVSESAVEEGLILRVNARGTAITAKYTGGIQYSGALIEGDIKVVVEENVLYQRHFKGEVPPAERLAKKRKRPQDAPFDRAFKNSAFRLSVHAVAYYLGAKNAHTHIVSALRGASVSDRMAAAEILGDLSDSRGVRPLIDALNDKSPAVRMNAVSALGTLGDPAATEYLIQALKDRDKDVQRAAAAALGELGDSRAVKPLIHALSNNLYVQSNAVIALGKIGTPAVEPLMALFQVDDLETMVRERIVETLGLIKDERSVSALILLLQNEDHWLRRRAEDALVVMGETGISRLLDLLLAKDLEIEKKLCIIGILGRIESPLAENALLDMLWNYDPMLRKEIAKALGNFCTENVIAALMEMVGNDEDIEVCAAARSSLDRILLIAE